VLKLPDAMDVGFGSVSVPLMGAGVLVAALTGLASLRLLLMFLRRRSLMPFVIYTALLGLLTLLLGE